MARIDYSNVSISLQQFEAVSSGKYNAGEVKLTGQSTLGSVNNHVHFRRFNNVTISHAEVVAIKNAFVRTLSEHGVGGEEIVKIRAKLGLAPSSPSDAKLSERSIKPLTRQQVREILDQYAGVLNIRTSAQITANVPEATRHEREVARQNVNNNLETSRATESNVALVTFQKVLSGDVDFEEGDAYYPMLREAKRQLDALYAGCGGNPSNEKLVKARCELPGGQGVVIDTGMSEAAYAEKLFQTITRLEYMDLSKIRNREVRTTYQNLDHAGRMNWIANLTHLPPDALVLARTAAVVALQEKGIADYEALSLVNKISLDSVVDLLVNLEDPEHHENWDMSRGNIVAILNQYPLHADENSGCVYIPATSPSQYNRGVRTFFQDLSDATPPAPPGFKLFAQELMADLRQRFGEDVVSAADKLDRYIDSSKLAHLVQIEGDGDFAQNVTCVRLEALRAPLTEMVLKRGAERAITLFAATVAKEINVNVPNETNIANAMKARYPNLIGTLVQCADSAQTAKVLELVRTETEKSVRRCAILDRYRLRDDFTNLVREELSALTGIPVSSLKGKDIPERRIKVLAGRLSGKINIGEVKADTEEEIKAKFREEARKIAKERADVLSKVDGLAVTDATKSELKTWILAQEKVSFIDFDDILGKMENVNDRAWKLSLALQTMRQKGNSATLADKNNVYQAMKNLSEEIDVLRDKLFEAKNIDAELPEQQALGTIVATLAIGGSIGIKEDIADFLARADVKKEMEDHWDNQDHISVEAYNYQRYAAPNVTEANAKIRDDIAAGAPDAMSGQAIVQGCREAGLTNVTPDEAIALFTTGKLLSGELLKAIDGLPAVATPEMIRTIVSHLIGRHAAQIQNGRPLPVLTATPAERKDSIINKLAGGTGAAAQKARQILETKLGPDPQDPESKTYGEIVRNVRAFLLKGLLHDLKVAANGEKGSYLSVDFNRNTINLAGVGAIKPKESEEAADCFARFVTGRKDATYAGLAKKEKAKADFAMAMAAQTSQNAILTGFSVMMDPDGRLANFTPSGSSDPGVWKVAMEFGQNGDLKVSVTAEMKPKVVAFNGGEVEMCNPGSTFKVAADFTFTASELNRITELDFKAYDGTAIDNCFDVEKPKDVCEVAIGLIPRDLRINAGIQVDIESTFN